MSFFISLKQSVKFSAVPAALTQEAEIVPTVGTGLFPSEGECERSAVPAALTQEAR